MKNKTKKNVYRTIGCTYVHAPDAKKSGNNAGKITSNRDLRAGKSK